MVLFGKSMKEEFPDIKEQGKNLAKFTVKVVKDVVINTGSDNEAGGFVSDAKDKQKERWDICKVCEHYSVRQQRCKKCGCYLEYKIKFDVSECPINKW